MKHENLRQLLHGLRPMSVPNAKLHRPILASPKRHKSRVRPTFLLDLNADLLVLCLFGHHARLLTSITIAAGILAVLFLDRFNLPLSPSRCLGGLRSRLHHRRSVRAIIRCRTWGAL